jgi:nucleotide-binding universal stress UspA family protein
MTCARCGEISATFALQCPLCGAHTEVAPLHKAASGPELEFAPRTRNASESTARQPINAVALASAKSHAAPAEKHEVLGVSLAMPRVILAASDLSAHSYRAVRRAAALSRQWNARLVLLHVVPHSEVNRPGAMDVAAGRLDQHAYEVAELASSSPEVVLRSGSVVKSIVAVAEELRADLVIMGARRRRAVRDLFVDRTTARVLRVAKVPVLLVNRPSTDRYGRVLLATDLSNASSGAAQYADALNLFDEANVSVLHAFMPFAKTKLIYSGARPDVIAAHVEHSARNALEEVVSTLRRDGLNMSRHHVILAEDLPVNAIRRTVKNRGSELVVIGTRGRTGIKRALLGSTAEEVLRTVKCDVLAVPPNVRAVGDSPPSLQGGNGPEGSLSPPQWTNSTTAKVEAAAKA